MADSFSVYTRINGADMEFVDKSSGNVVFAIRSGGVVDTSGATSLLTPAPQVQIATVNITAAQILALHGTPITIVPAPGANKLVDVSAILYEFNYGTVQYATSTGVVNLYWGSGGTAIGTNGIASALLKGSSSLIIGDVPAFAANTSGVALTSMLNKAVVLQNPSATEYTAGDSTLVVKVAYRIQSGL